MSSRARTALARVGAWALEAASSDRWVRWLAKAEHARTVLDEAQGAFWHLTALPSRRDVRLITRRAATLERRVAELERLVTRLEAAQSVSGRPQPGEGRPESGGDPQALTSCPPPPGDDAS